jgi:hypothetical protein
VLALALALSLAACSSGDTHALQPAAAVTTTTAPAPAAAPTTPRPAAPPTSTTITRAPGPPGLPGPPGTLGPVAWTPEPWLATGRAVNGSPAVFTALLHPSTGGAPIGAARLDGSRLRFALYAGTGDPGGSWTNQGAVPASLWPSLVATFNSGFKLAAARGGFYADGHANPPLRSGAASFVIFQDGSATVGQWGRDVQLTANVAAVRQNLELLVDGGRPSGRVATNIQPTWGFTLNNQIVNWRSAVGVDGGGQVLYVGGPGLDPSALADALIAVGAVRAMELDINPAWVSFNTFTDAGAGGVTATKLLPGMNRSGRAYLSPFNRDFFAVFSR